MSDANEVIKQAAIDWFGADWQRAAGFGGYVLQQLEASGYEVRVEDDMSCLCEHDESEHHKVGDRIECFTEIAEGWLCGCMNYEPKQQTA